MDPITMSVLSKALPYAPSVISGGVRAISSFNRLRGLENQPLPRFDTTQSQRNIDMYQRRFRQGLSPEERAEMSQQFQTEQAGMYRQTSERAGGQISNFLGRVSALDRARNAMRTGSMMAQERRAAMSGLAGARQGLQSQLNAQTQMDMRRRMTEEQALGQGMKAGLNTLEKGLSYGIQSGVNAMGGGSDSTGIPDAGVGSIYNPVLNPFNTDYQTSDTSIDYGSELYSRMRTSPFGQGSDYLDYMNR